MPIALLWGARDPIIPMRHDRKTLRRLKGSALTTYRGCGHYPQLDNAERLAGDLSAFLRDPARPKAVFVRSGA